MSLSLPLDTIQPLSDGSRPLFNMYLNLAEKEDMKMAESWKGDADGMLVFTGVFSAAVAALLAATIQDIRPNPQDTSAFYLATISQQLAQSNGTQFSIPSSLSNPAASFTAPTWAVWVNGLWFLSLVISITCAVLATLLQHWAYRYLRLAHPPYSPHKRARIRAFYRRGVEDFHCPWLVEVLPALLHISLFLFLAGLSVFLFSVNSTIFKAVIAWVALFVIVYAYLTVLPIRRKNSPYSVPFSTLVSFCFTGIRSGFYQLIERFPRLVQPFLMRIPNRNSAAVHLQGFFSHSLTETAEQFARQLGPEIDYDSLVWMFDSLDEDQELEKFFEGIPGLCSSPAVPNAQLGVIRRHEKKFSNALIEFMNRTLSSNLISESVKQRRINICTKVVDVTSLLGPWWILRRVLLGDWQKFLRCIEFGLFVKSWSSIRHSVTRFYAECVAAVIISSVPERDDRWLQLASGPLDASKRNLLINPSTNCDNILLANTISIVRRTIQTFSGSPEPHRSDILGASTKTLESLRKLDIQKTEPELQHEFCSVWNQLVDLAKNDRREYIVCVAKTTLKNIRKLYLVLHKETDAYPKAFSGATDEANSVLDDPNSYCTCSLAEHGPCKGVPLKIEEPVPEVTVSGLPAPTIPPVTNSASQSHSTFPPTNSPAPVLQPQPTAQTPAFSQPTQSSASHLLPQVHFGRPPPPLVGPTSHVPRGPSLPLPQVVPTFPVLQVPPRAKLRRGLDGGTREEMSDDTRRCLTADGESSRTV